MSDKIRNVSRTYMDNSVRFSLPNDKTVDQEIRHIGFVKVHKAASSTMQNIFFRFGLMRNLSFVFTENPNYFSRYYNVTYPVVPARLRDGYDILCIHSVFDEEKFANILPADSVYLAIVRDPVSVFVSAVNFYSQKSQLLSYLEVTPGNKLRTLLDYPQIYDTNVFSYTRNVMARDLGFSKSMGDKQVLKRLGELNTRFKLVLLADYFDESLVLMRRYLNWRLQDILYMPTNVYNKTGWSMLDLNETHINRLKKRNKLDFAVYEFFHEAFWNKFRAEDPSIHEEVLHFKDVLKTVRTFCQRVVNINMKTLSKPSKNFIIISKSKWNDQFSVRGIDCRFMQKEELKFIKILRRLQGSVINETLY